MTDDAETTSALADNRAAWDDRADIHAASQFYSIDALLADPDAVTKVVRRDLAVLAPHLGDLSGLPDGAARADATGPLRSPVDGRSLLHLQCHIGDDTLSWWRLGARDVHGLDFSPKSLENARRIAERAGAPITFVEGDARRASDVISRTFEVIVTSAGTIVWLPDLESWARSIAELLEPGGVFMIRDDHPLLAAMEFEPWDVSTDYLSGGGQDAYDADQSYTGDAMPSHTNHEWHHDLAEVVSALLDAGLEIRELGEHPVMDWKPLRQMVGTEAGWRLPVGSPRIPLTFSVVAVRPER